MPNVKVLVFNGPPGSGKDAAARAVLSDVDIRTRYTVQFERFSMPLKRALAGFFNVPIDLYGDCILEANKNDPTLIGGTSYRNAQIRLSEEYAKPFFGRTVFGDLMVQRIDRGVSMSHRYGWREDGEPQLILVPDSGFLEELEPLVTRYGADAIRVVKLFREGKTYEGDSRSYIKCEPLGVLVERIENDATIAVLLDTIKRRLRGWL